jgi:hypothetical protein
MGYTTGAKCNHCNTEVQSVRHLFLECPRVQLLLKNFKKQYNLLTKLCECARRGTSIVQHAKHETNFQTGERRLISHPR